MTTVPAILLSLLLPAAEPVSPEEIQVAVAAIEEARTRFYSIDVTFRTWAEVPAGIERPPERPADADAEHAYEWAWKAGKEHWLRTSESSRSEWWHDGRKTYEWYFDNVDEEKPDRVWIHHSPPRLSLSHNVLANILGFRVFGFDGGISRFVQEAAQRKTLIGRRDEDNLVLDLGPHDINRVLYDVSVSIEAFHDYRLVSWSLERDVPLDVGGQQLPDAHRYRVDEFQSVEDESSGAAVWFPLRGRLEQPGQVTWLAVDMVKINADIPDERFTPPEMPFGTQVYEEIAPGKPPKEYLIGGDPAEQARLERLTAIAEEEQSRLDREGVTYNATPRTSSRFLSVTSTIVGVLFLLLGGYLYWRRNRQVTYLPAR